MRCLALAQAWQDVGGNAAFAVADLPAALEQRIVSEGFSVVRVPAQAGTSGDAEFTADTAARQSVEWVVVDGDHFDVAFLGRVQSSSHLVLLIDDFARREAFPADLILNPNLGATELAYRSRNSNARLLVGQSYALLRREFTSWNGRRVFPEKGNRALVTLGGSDPENLTPQIVQALDDLNGYEITAVVGPGSIHAAGVYGLHSPNVRVVSNPPDMRLAMEQSDLAIIAAGGTLWELLFMQCVVLSYARNPVQASVIEYLHGAGAVRNMGATADFRGPALVAAVEELASSVSARKRMADVGRRTVDGEGAMRLMRALRTQGGSA
jgi:spore coat polysaccharide biosynthesis predicted glycosyltransferase SpsG